MIVKPILEAKGPTFETSGLTMEECHKTFLIYRPLNHERYQLIKCLDRTPGATVTRDELEKLKFLAAVRFRRELTEVYWADYRTIWKHGTKAKLWPAYLGCNLSVLVTSLSKSEFSFGYFLVVNVGITLALLLSLTIAVFFHPVLLDVRRALKSQTKN